MSCLLNFFAFRNLEDFKNHRSLKVVLILQWQVRHTIHILLFGDKGANSYKAKSAEEQQQRSYAEPLYSVD